MLTFILKLGHIQLGNKSTTSRESLHLKIKIPSNEMLFHPKGFHRYQICINYLIDQPTTLSTNYRPVRERQFARSLLKPDG